MDEWVVTGYSVVEGFVDGITLDDKDNIYYTTQEKIWCTKKHNLDLRKLVTSVTGNLRGIVWHDDTLYACNSAKNKVISYSLKNSDMFVVCNDSKDKRREYFVEPRAICLSKSGKNMYIAIRTSIRIFNFQNKTLNFFAGTGREGWKDGPIDEANFDEPSGFVMDSDGTLYVCEGANVCVRKIKNGNVSTVAGSSGRHRGVQDGPCAQAIFEPLCGIVLDKNGDLLVVGSANYSNHPVRKIDLKHNRVTTCKIPYLRDARSIAIDKDGTLYIGSVQSIWKIERPWKWKRWLWIGYLKEDKSYCLLPLLPKELVKEICDYISRPFNIAALMVRKRKRT